MNRTRLSTLLLALAALSTAAQAQFTLPSSGSREITLGGSGTADGGLDDSAGGVSFSYGSYATDQLMWSIRQTINHANPEDSGSSWNGSTRLAGDYHFGTGRLRPLLGANFGYIYGKGVTDTWAAGVEGGLKYYIQDRTFLYGMVEYAWFFKNARSIDDTFDDGRFVWTLGVGFNF